MKGFVTARTLAASIALCCAVGVSGCAALTPGSDQPQAAAEHTDSAGRLRVATSFYPVQYLAQTIGGEHVSVSTVTPANVEPHDFELAPRDVTALAEDAAVFYASGFQPSLDDALAEVSGPRVVDLASTVDLVRHDGATEHDHGDDHSDSHAEGHEDSDHGTHDGLDPHFWLDPIRMRQAATTVEQALASLDPTHAADYQANLVALTTTLDALDHEYATGLAQCERHTLVTAHSAFGYLADRYHLTQASVTGIDPESDPSPARIAAIKEVVQDTGATTIFTEDLLPTNIAHAVAAETGATTAPLATLETEPADSSDYPTAMRANLSQIRTALDCQ